MKQKKTLENGLVTHIIKDDKFQEVFMSLKIMFPLEEKLNTTANLLSRMMGDRLETSPSKKEMSYRLDMMYGAKSSSSSYSIGSYQVIDVSMLAIADSFVNDDLMSQQLTFMKDTLLHPLLNEKTLQEAKNNLKMTFAHIKDNPSQYAMTQGFKHAGEGQVFGLTSMGNAEDIDAITLDDIYACHEMLINKAHKQLYIVGPVSFDLNLDIMNVGTSEPLNKVLINTHIDAKLLEEHYDGAQTELVLVYETDIDPHHPLYHAYLVYIATLGQLPSSLLFQNIREKHSLAYSIYASRRMFDGVFAILTGINDKNLDQTIALIQEQIDYLKTGEIDIESAKSYLILQLESIMEKQKPWSDHVFRNEILGLDTDVSEIQTELAKVSIDDLRAVANMVKAPFIYAYRGGHDESNQ